MANMCQYVIGCLWLLQSVRYDLTISWSISEDTTHKYVRSPQMMADNFTAAQIKDIKTKMVESIVCFKQCSVCVWSKELKANK